MSYEYDVFVSFCRIGKRAEWVEGTFMPLFETYLAEDMAGVQKPKVFVDYEGIPEGASWPQKLAQSLSRSKVLVALWTPPYFSSSWCMTELSLMYAREQGCKYRSKKHPEGLIIPASLHDGDNFPPQAKAIQQLKLQKLSSLWLAENSSKREELSEKIQHWVPSVTRAIQDAPKFDSSWLDLAYEKFMKNFEIENPEQTDLPGL